MSRVTKRPVVYAWGVLFYQVGKELLYSQGKHCFMQLYGWYCWSSKARSITLELVTIWASARPPERKG